MPFRTPLARLNLIRTAACICIGLIVWLSWIPPQWEVRTGIAGQYEHIIAYCGAAAIWAFAYQEPRRWPLIAAFVTLAAILEVGQFWIPGRHAHVIDFAASSAGTIAGVFLGRPAIDALMGFVMRRGF